MERKKRNQEVDKVPRRWGQADGFCLGSLVFEVQSDFQDLISQATGVHIVHVCEHYDAGAPFGHDRKRGARSLLPAGMGQDVNAKLVRKAPPKAVAGGLVVSGL